MINSVRILIHCSEWLATHPDLRLWLSSLSLSLSLFFFSLKYVRGHLLFNCHLTREEIPIQYFKRVANIVVTMFLSLFSIIEEDREDWMSTLISFKGAPSEGVIQMWKNWHFLGCSEICFFKEENPEWRASERSQLNSGIRRQRLCNLHKIYSVFYSKVWCLALLKK